jgi:hypothetical protein
MPNINLPSGNTIWVSTYEYYFKLDEKDVEAFFQSCMADNLGIYIDNPFSGRISMGKLDTEETEEPPDLDF